MRLAWAGFVLLCASRPAFAQTVTATASAMIDTPQVALASARAAFEYRDFKKVVEILSPWVHPPRIADPALMREARTLLGISLHVTGNPVAAADEFSQALVQDPLLKLDPFVVPPQVIQTFESVRERMRPVLDRILEQRKQDAEAEALEPVELHTHPIAAYAPFGLSHFLVLDRPGWGTVWLTLQVIGLAGNIGGYWAARGLRVTQIDENGQEYPFVEDQDLDSVQAANVVQIAGLGFFAATWLASAIHGGVLLSDQNARAAARLERSRVRGSLGGLEIDLW